MVDGNVLTAKIAKKSRSAQRRHYGETWIAACENLPTAIVNRRFPARLHGQFAVVDGNVLTAKIAKNSRSTHRKYHVETRVAASDGASPVSTGGKETLSARRGKPRLYVARNFPPRASSVLTMCADQPATSSSRRVRSLD